MEEDEEETQAQVNEDFCEETKAKIEEEQVISNNDKQTQLLSEDKDNDNDIMTSNESHGKEQDQPHIETEAKLFLQTKKNKEMDLKQFFKQQRHYFIMTDGGKPIYSRYGDEIKNSEILATFSAIITKFTVFNTDESFAEKLNYISNEKSTIVFLKKGNIIFIALSKLHDSISFLYSQLELLYSQLLSIITSGRMTKLEENPNCCMNTLIDTQELFEQMLILTSSTIVSHIAAYQVLPFENRYKLNDICNVHRGNALICCLLSPIEIIALSKTNLITLTYTDVLLMQNFILHSESLLSTESWVPLCLPGISAEGYLQMYSNFTDRIGVVFITESQDYEYFLKFAEKSRVIIQELIDKQLLPKIERNLKLKNDVKGNSFDRSQMVELYKRIFQLSDNCDDDICQESLLIKNDNEVNDSKLSENLNEIQPESKIQSGVNADDTIDTNINANDKLNQSSIKNMNDKIVLQSKPESIPVAHFSENVYRVKDIKKDPLIKLKYAICKQKVFNQYFSINFGPVENITHEELDIYAAYGRLYDIYNSQVSSFINTNNFFHFEKDDKYSHCIFTSDNYILMASFNLFMPFEEMHSIGKEMLKVVKSYESNFFITIK